MSDVDIVLNIATTGVKEVYGLSNALQQLNRAIQGSVNPMRSLDARAKALSAAIGSSDSSLKNHAKTISEVARNNAILTNEMMRVRKEISGLGTSYKFASDASSDFRKIAIRDLKAYEQSLKGIRVRALVEDLKSVSQEQKRLGKDAQFVGRSLIIGLTTPIMGFARVGLQSLVAIDKEFVRLNKVLESVAPNIESAAKKMSVDLNSASKEQNKQLQTMVDRYNQLDKALTNTSMKFGLAKSLTVGLAGDFAELGIQTTENIALITELTAKTEKLGNMDIGAAKDLVQSLYFQALRAMQQSGESVGMPFQERERKAIQAATAQLNLFNSVENVTALTLRDLGDAFPEVAAAATSFGLSMTEAAALLAPMKAAGFETGASANSIKVSLQRLTAPTKQNAEMFKELSKQYNVNFQAIKGTGLDAIQQLIDGFNTLKDSTAGQEGAMEFFSKVFGVRQGPRMEVAIAQMAEFDKLLKNNLIPETASAEKKLQNYANTAIASANVARKANLPVINSFRDIGIIARIATANAGQAVEGLTKRVTQEQIEAAKQVRAELSQEILKAQRESGEDLIGQVGTEAGRAMFIELAGGANAAQIAQRELDASLASLDTQLSILKNNFKMFTADLVKGLKPALEKITELSTKLYNAWTGLDDRTKKLISTIALLVGGSTAAIGPLIFVFGQFRLAMGSIGKVLFGFLPGLKTMSVETLAAKSGMLNLTKALSMQGDTVVNTSGKFATFIATIASGNGPVGTMARKLGEMTGVLQKTSTAPLPVMRALMAQQDEKGIMSGVNLALGGVSSVPSSTMPTGFKALSSAAIGPSAMPAMPTLRKLTAAELALPDADRIAHEAKVAKKAAEAYAERYNRTIERLLGGRPIPRAGMGTGPSISPTGLYRYPAGTVTGGAFPTFPGGVITGSTVATPASPTGKIGGRLLNWRKIQAQADAEASAVRARVESLENARGLRELKKYNAERIAELRANVTEENKIALQRFQDLVSRRDQQVQAILAEENAIRKARSASLKAQQEAKGLTTKLGGVGTGTLTKERFFRGRRIDDEQFDAIMGGGLRGRFTSGKLRAAMGLDKAKDIAGAAPDKFLGGRKTVDTFKGLGTFGKDLFTQPSKALSSFTGLFKNSFSSIVSTFGKIGPMFGKFVGYIKNPMSMLLKFKSVIMGLGPAILTAISSFGAVTGIGIIIAGVVAIIVILVKHWDEFVKAIQPGIDALKDTFDILKDAVMGLVQPVIDFFNALSDGGEGANPVVSAVAGTFNVLAVIIKGIAIAIKFLFVEVFGRVIKIALSSVIAILRGIGNFIMGIWSLIKGIVTFNWGSIVDGFKKIGKGIAQIAIGLMGPFAGFFTFILKGLKKVFDFLGKLPSWAGGGIFRKVSEGIGGAIKFIEDTRSTESKKGKGKADAPDVDTDPLQEKIASATGDGMKEGADEGAKELAKRAKQALKDLKREVQEEIADRIKNAMESVVEQIQDALKAQKEASLKIYDDQIKKIEQVGKTEGRLTKEIEYQNRLREAETERSLNRINSKRSYALAVYAGQIDEATSIADAAAAQEIKDNEKINDINQDRAKEVAEQNRADLIDAIKDAKQKASEYFDGMITSFTNAAKKITEFPPTTAEEFNTMLNQLIEGGNGFIGARTIANNMGTMFSESFSGALSQLGVNAAGPLTSSLEAIGKTLTENNPFGENGIWNKTIDASIDALTRKYKGLTNTLTTIINTKSDAFKELYSIYKKYQDLVNPAETTTGGGTGGGTSGGNNGGYGKGFNNDGVKVGNKVAIAAANADLKKIKNYSDKYLQDKYGGTAEGKRLVASIKGTVGAIASSAVLLGGHDEGMKDYFPIVTASKYRDQITTNSELIYAYIINNRSLFMKGAGTQGRTDESGRSGFFKGGMPYGMGGPTKGPIQQGIPAILHGGEYVVRNSAVKKYGWGMMQQINQGTYKPRPYATGGMIQEPVLSNNLDVEGLNMGTDPNFNTTRSKIRQQYADFYNSLKLSKAGRDKALYEWQVSMGGLNYNFMRQIWRKESKDWKNKGAYAGGGLGISYENWKKWGGLEFSDFPYKANPFQQMIVYNRMVALGYAGKYGIKEKAKSAASAIAGYGGELQDFHFGTKNAYKNYLYTQKNIPRGKQVIISEDKGIGYTVTGSAGIRDFYPLSSLKTSAGSKYVDPREASFKPFSYAIGGLVKDGGGEFGTRVNWNKQNEKLFKKYISEGYISKDGYYVSPYGSEGPFKSVNVPGLRWMKVDTLQKNAKADWVLRPFNGLEPMWQGGTGAGKDFNVWNAKAKQALSQDKGVLPGMGTLKGTGYGLVSLLTDIKHSARRAFGGQDIKDIFNPNAPGIARVGAGVNFASNIAPFVKPISTIGAGQITKKIGPLGAGTIGQGLERKLPSLGDVIDLSYNPKTGSYGFTPEAIPQGPKVLMKGPNKAALDIYRESIKKINLVLEKDFKLDTFGGVDTRKIMEMFKIGNEKVVFGASPSIKELISSKSADVKFLDKNPYEITGVDPLSEMGEKVAYDYFMALAAHTAGWQQGQKGTYNLVESLLYASTRGDSNAYIQYRALVEKGIALKKELLADPDNFGLKASPSISAEITRRGIDSLGLENLFIVHETPYKPMTDKFGNTIIKPTGDFKRFFEPQDMTIDKLAKESGYSYKEAIAWLKRRKKENPELGLKIWSEKFPGKYSYSDVDFASRDTIHFALNHRVAGHGQRESLKSGWIVISKLIDVMNKNPGALTNLKDVDTYFTPKVGKGLILPKKSTFINTIDDKTNAWVTDTILSQIPEEIWKNKFFPIMPGGSHGSEDSVWNQYILDLANKYKIMGGPHFESPSYNATGLRDYSVEEMFIGGMHGWQFLTKNDIARLFYKRNPFSGVIKRNVSVPREIVSRRMPKIPASRTVAFNGGLMPNYATGGLIRGFANGGFVSAFASQGVPAMLHGGEYVVNSSAVRNLGISALEAINNMRFNAPKNPSYSGAVQPQTTSTSTVHIYVDNFIGEKQWFESMMKDYNINVAPQNQKAAGLNNTTISTYRGINRGL